MAFFGNGIFCIFDFLVFFFFQLGLLSPFISWFFFFREKTKAALIALDEKIFVERRMSSLSVTTNGDTNVKTKPEFYVSFEDIQVSGTIDLFNLSV